MANFTSVDEECSILQSFLSDLKGVTPPLAKPLIAGQSAAFGFLRTLQQPIRIAVYGGEGSGSNQIVNLLIGKSLVPETDPSSFPKFFDFTYGDTETTHFRHEGGPMEMRNGLDADIAANPDLRAVNFKLRHPLLKHIKFTYLTESNKPAHRQMQSKWIGDNADICLWCTPAYDPWPEIDNQLWSRVPDRLKDDSLLVLTTADANMSSPAVAAIVDEVSDRALEEFSDLIAISPRSANAAIRNGAVLDNTAWKQSGGPMLVHGLMALAPALRQIQVDKSRIFIRQQLPVLYDVINSAGATTVDPVVRAPVSEAPQVESPVAPVQEIRQPDQTNVASFADAQLGVAKGSSLQIPQEILLFLNDQIDEMLQLVEDNEPSRFLMLCQETLEELSMMISDNDDLDESGTDLLEQVQSAHELTSILIMEADDAAQSDAADLTLQIAQDLSRNAA